MLMLRDGRRWACIPLHANKAPIKKTIHAHHRNHSALSTDHVTRLKRMHDTHGVQGTRSHLCSRHCSSWEQPVELVRCEALKRPKQMSLGCKATGTWQRACVCH